jgi:hypothetical protein
MNIKGQSSEILILFFDIQDRPAHDYKPLWVLKYFNGPQDFTSNLQRK